MKRFLRLAGKEMSAGTCKAERPLVLIVPEGERRPDTLFRREVGSGNVRITFCGFVSCDKASSLSFPFEISETYVAIFQLIETCWKEGK